jgi:tRNA 2-selenouridine synthase
MAWLMNTVGIRTSILEGGYKAFRRFVQAAFEKPLHLVVLGGMTGSGKTRVLEALEDMGQQVIHLERLASHKGSVFGGIGMPSQPTTEQFENNLFHCIGRIDANQPVFVEDESITIGRIFIPRPFYNRMSTAPLITIHVPSEQRIEQLVGMYATGNETQLVEGINRLVKRLGQENASETVGLVESGNLSEAVGRLLPYYDKLYKRSMEKHKRLETIHLEGGFDDPTVIASRILSLIHIP